MGAGGVVVGVVCVPTQGGWLVGLRLNAAAAAAAAAITSIMTFTSSLL